MINVNEIRKYLEKKNLKFWKISESDGFKSEIYTIFDDIESSRSFVSKSFTVSLAIDHDKYTGNSTFSISPTLSISEMEKTIDKGMKAASLVKNQYYPIEQKIFAYPKIENVEEKMDDFFVKVREAMDGVKGVKFCSSELILSHGMGSFINSFGNTLEHRGQSTTLDMVFLTEDEKYESQFLRFARSIDELQIKETVEKYSKFAQDSQKAKTLKTGRYNVLFTEEVLEELFTFFLCHASGSAFHNKYSSFKKGERVFKEGNGTPLYITSDPTLKGREVIVDRFGNPLKKFSIIENSELVNIVADVRYAHYLKESFTGPLSNVVIGCGKKSYNDLAMEEGTLIIPRVSAFSPKEITGDLAGEIRLGYLVKNGELHPVKGGSFSGNLKDLMPDALFSKEEFRINGYIGPRGIKMNGVNIAGGE